MKQAYGYIRLSKLDEGKPGHGLGAQRAAIQGFCKAHGYNLVDIQEEIQSGRAHDAIARRPVFAGLLAKVRKAKATLIVSHIDRLARNMAFGSKLMEQGIDFKAVECGPDADRLYLHMRFMFAEEEHRKISTRFRAMWAQKRRRGDQVGRTDLKALRRASVKGGLAMRQDAKEFALRMWPTVEALRGQDMTWMQIADQLNATKTPTAAGEDRGGRWTAQQIFRLRQYVGA